MSKMDKTRSPNLDLIAVSPLENESSLLVVVVVLHLFPRGSREIVSRRKIGDTTQLRLPFVAYSRI